MIFLVNNSYTYWASLFLLNNKNQYIPYNFIFDGLVVFLQFPILFRTCYIISKYQVFHKNLTILLNFQLILWIEPIIAKIILIPYRNGFRLVGNHSRIYQHYWTENEAEMVPIESFWDEPKLFFSSCLFVHFYASMLFFVLTVSIERAISTYYLSDYEKKPRLYISLCLLTLTFSLSCLVAYIFLIDFFTFTAFGTIIILIGITSLSLYIFVWLYNIRIGHKNYSLSRRFQCHENLKSLDMAKRVVTTYAILNFVVNASFCIVNFSENAIIWRIFTQVIDNATNMVPIIICPVTIFSIDTWKMAAFRYFYDQRRKGKVKEIELDRKKKKEDEDREHTEMYFEHLNKSWI